MQMREHEYMETLLREPVHAGGDFGKALDISFGLLEIGIDGMILNSNETYRRMSGYASADLVGKSHKILCSGEEIVSGK